MSSQLEQIFIHTIPYIHTHPLQHTCIHHSASVSFLLVIGCADPDLPELTWFKRLSDTRGIMGCEYTEVTWQVDCKSGQWNTGPVGPTGSSSIDCSKRKCIKS